jgi:hypothetical protein
MLLKCSYVRWVVPGDDGCRWALATWLATLPGHLPDLVHALGMRLRSG